MLIPTEHLMDSPDWPQIRELLLADDLSPREQRRLDDLADHGELYLMEVERTPNSLRITSDLGNPATSLSVEFTDATGIAQDDQHTLECLMRAVDRAARAFL